jgi:hypothetical protein
MAKWGELTKKLFLQEVLQEKFPDDFSKPHLVSMHADGTVSIKAPRTFSRENLLQFGLGTDKNTISTTLSQSDPESWYFVLNAQQTHAAIESQRQKDTPEEIKTRIANSILSRYTDDLLHHTVIVATSMDSHSGGLERTHVGTPIEKLKEADVVLTYDAATNKSAVTFMKAQAFPCDGKIYSMSKEDTITPSPEAQQSLATAIQRALDVGRQLQG